MLRGTKDFTIFGSNIIQGFNATAGWTPIVQGRLPPVPSPWTRCNARNTTFNLQGGMASAWRFLKFEAETFYASGPALEYIGLFGKQRENC